MIKLSNDSIQNLLFPKSSNCTETEEIKVTEDAIRIRIVCSIAKETRKRNYKLLNEYFGCIKSL